jgi:hypothetical protein
VSKDNQTLSMKTKAWLESFCDYINNFSFTMTTNYLNTKEDGMPLVHLELKDWVQQGPPTFDVFENDEGIAKFMVLREGIPSRDHKFGFILTWITQHILGSLSISLVIKMIKMTKMKKKRTSSL